MPLRILRAGHPTASPRVSEPFVTSISSNGRYFQDQFNNPILVKGHSGWAGFRNTSLTEARSWYSHLRTYGYNASILDFVSSSAIGGTDNGATFDGILPFTGGDITQFNSTYWTRMDSHLQIAQEYGITIFAFPMDAYTLGTGRVFNGKTVADCTTYGTNLGNRYPASQYPNLMWFFGNDYVPDGGATEDQKANGVITGLRSTGDVRPVSIMLNFWESLSSDDTYWNSRVQWNCVYSYYAEYEAVLRAYRNATVRPALLSEARYEGEGGGPGEPTPQIAEVLRKQACWSLTSGSPGDFYGTDDWDFHSGWESRLATWTAEAQLQKIRAWFSNLAWHTLVPDDLTALVTAGRGTKVTTVNSGVWPAQNDYVTACKNAAGTLAVIYVPSNSGNTARTITLDPAQMGTGLAGTWVDPTDATQSQAATISSNQTTTPGTHADGTRDWLLKLTAN